MVAIFGKDKKGGTGEVPIRNLEEWEKYGGPKEDYQWEPGRSAMELAKAWLGPEGPQVPPVFANLLESHEETKGFVPERADAELEIYFDSFSGPRNADLQVKGTTPGGVLAVSIEGKADESFGTSTVERAIADARKRTPNTNVPKRVEGLCQALFGKPYSDRYSQLWYQLLYAPAAALVKAKEDGASKALFLVWEISSSSTKPVEQEKNDRDFRQFFSVLGNVPAESLESGKIHGPFQVPGGGSIPSDIPLYVAKIQTQVP